MKTTRIESLAGRDILHLADLSAAEIRSVLDLATVMKRDYAPWRASLAQRAAVLLFEKPSLRTRVSFEVGLAKMGAIAVYLDHQNSPIGVRETTADYGRNLERWSDVIIARVHRNTTLQELARSCDAPIVNALCDVSHPCQALADALTLEEHGVRLDSMRLAYVGDGNNVCHSLIELAATMGGSIVVVTPPGYEPMPEVVERARTLAAVSGGEIELSHDPKSIAGTDAVYTDTWVSMGQKDDGSKAKAMRPLQVNPALMAIAGPKALFMHCLPAHRGEEVVDAVIDGPTSVVFDQAENRMHAQNSLIAHVLGARPETHT